MVAENTALQTLQQAIRYFGNQDVCLAEMVKLRWPDGVVTCPTCGNQNVRFIATRRVWECPTKHQRRQFSVKVGTIMEDSPIKLDKWLTAMWLISNAKNGISSYELHRSIGVTQKTAWFMLHRVRLAMQDTDTGGKMGGHIEVDETYIGGEARKMHKAKRERVIKGTGGMGKVAVMLLLQGHGNKGQSTVRLSIVENTRKRALQGKVRDNVQRGSSVYTDALLSDEGLSDSYVHNAIEHAEKYVDGQVHTNGCETSGRC
jgi:hypothetical protein